MKQENNYDEIDKTLFEFFENASDVPDSTRYTIQNAFDIPPRSKRRKNIRPIYNIRRIANLAISFICISTSIVLAISFISKLFTNSTDGIDSAVENGYVQNVNMEFIENNDIGIKVDNLIMDDTNLDMSFIYYSKNDKTSDLQINEFIIRDENNNIICFELDNNNHSLISNNYSTFYCTRTEKRIIDENNKIRESILCTAEKLPHSKKLIFEIKSFLLTENSNTTTILGNWIFTLNMENKIIERKSENYSTSYDKYIKEISTNLTETSLEIDIKLNTNLNEDILLELNSTKLTNNFNQEYTCIYKNFKNENNLGHIILKYDISKFFENIHQLNLQLKFDNDKISNIYLSK